MEKNILRRLLSQYSNKFRPFFLGSCLLLLFQASAQENLLFEKGMSLFNEQRFKEAISFFEKAAEAEDSIAEHHYWVGASCIEALQTANLFQKATLSYQARSSLLKALELDSTHVLARVRLANYYIQAPAIAGGSYTKAMEQAEALEPYNAIKSAELKATIHFEKEEYDLAEEVFLSLLEEESYSYKVYYRLSAISLQRNDFERGLEFCQLSIDQFPEYLMGYYQFGKISALGNVELEQGLQHLEYYVNQEIPSNLPKKHWAYLRVGQIRQHQGEQQKARMAYEKSLALESGFREASKALNELQD